MSTSVLNENIIASGTGEGSIVLWDLASLSQESPEPEIKKTKKKKIEVKELPIKKEIHGIHSMEITDMQFVGPSQLLTGSHDHSLKVTDLSKETAISTLHTAYAGVCSLDSTQNVVFTGLTDKTMRQWDIRDCAQIRVYGDTHTSWVSSVAINPLNRNIIATGGYDKIVYLWDIRGDKKPLRKVCEQKDRVMAVGWNGPKKILSGGCEGQIYAHSLNFDNSE